MTRRRPLALGLDAEVVPDLEPVMADDPTQEALAEILMTALQREDGRAAELLERAREIRRRGSRPAASHERADLASLVAAT